MYIEIQMYPEDLHEYARLISLLQVRICHCSAALLNVVSLGKILITCGGLQLIL